MRESSFRIAQSNELKFNKRLPTHLFSPKLPVIYHEMMCTFQGGGSLVSTKRGATLIREGGKTKVLARI